MAKLSWVVILLLTLSSCGKETSQVPNVPVNLNIPLTDPRISSLITGSAAIFNGYGVAGIIIYRSANGYKAYDRCSTVNPEKRCAVIVANGEFRATDPCSGAIYSLEDNGIPAKAPATIALRQYAIIVAGNNLLVTN